ncbi:MAG: hypothetical protein FJ335_02450, partial [Sphingomonadales bacterium]|nr:hypothetical protein [Sphingomonadales bacterium]
MARLSIAMDRVGPCVRTIRFVGLDLTGIFQRMEVRLQPETPGQPQIALQSASSATDEGLFFVGLTDRDGVPVSEMQLRIAEEKVKALPYFGELGSTATFSYDWIIDQQGQDRRRLITGEIIVVPTTYGMNNAPSGRPDGSTTSGDTTIWRTRQIVYRDGDVVEIKSDFADLYLGEITRAEAAAVDARASADEAADFAAAAANAGGKVRTTAAPAFGVSVVDDQRNLVAGFDVDEVAHPQIRMIDQRARRDQAAHKVASTLRLLGSAAHLIIYGQSLSQGTEAQRARPDIQPAAGLRFIGGERAQDAGTSAAAKYGSAFAPLHAQDFGDKGQTMASSMVDMVCQLVLREDGIDLAAAGQRFLVSAPGEPGTPIAGLTRGTAPFQRLQSDIAYGRSIAAASGHQYQLSAHVWQGLQSNVGLGTSPDGVKSAFRALHSAIAEEGTNAGALPVPLVSLLFGLSTWPTNGGTSANPVNRAVLALCGEDTDKFFVAPEYA